MKVVFVRGLEKYRAFFIATKSLMRIHDLFELFVEYEQTDEIVQR